MSSGVQCIVSFVQNHATMDPILSVQFTENELTRKRMNPPLSPDPTPHLEVGRLPWRAPICGGDRGSGCYWDKMKFVKWLQEYKGWARDEFHRGEYWEAEYVCEKCGKTKTTVKMRTTRELKNAGILK